MKTLLLLFLTIPFLFSYAQKDTGTITVTVENVKNTDGMVRMLLFEKNKGFPNQLENALMSKSVNIDGTSVNLLLEEVPYGEYAISVLHDENDNQTMDTNFIGIPKEGYGFSNNASSTFSAPDFEGAAFKLDSANKSVKIKLKN